MFTSGVSQSAQKLHHVPDPILTSGRSSQKTADTHHSWLILGQFFLEKNGRRVRRQHVFDVSFGLNICECNIGCHCHTLQGIVHFHQFSHTWWKKSISFKRRGNILEHFEQPKQRPNTSPKLAGHLRPASNLSLEQGPRPCKTQTTKVRPHSTKAGSDSLRQHNAKP